LSASIPQTQEVWKLIAQEEWSRWRLIMAEDCSITKTEAFEMDDIDLYVANAALDIVIAAKNRKSKGGK
jgi:hypothetical protein